MLSKKRFIINNNIIIIKGARNYCIYNLNSKKLFNIDAVYYSYIRLLISGKNIYNVPIKARRALISEEIIVKPQKATPIIKYNTSGVDIKFAWIEISQNCNLRCKHCYENSSIETRRHIMPYKDFQIVLDRISDYGIKQVQLIGGEPFLHKNIKEMMIACSGRFDFVEVFTNGTLLDDSLLKIIKDHGIHLAFSIYSEDKKIHDNVTQINGSFTDTFANVKKAINQGIKCRIASVEMKEVPEFRFSEIIVDHKTDLLRLTGRANIHLYDENLIKKKLITKDSFRYPIIPENIYRNMERHNCFSGKIYIDAYLEVYPCVMERRVSHGSIRNTNLANVLKEDITKMNKDDIKECCLCEFRYACYDCRPDSNGEDIKSKPWFCTYNPQSGTWIDIDQFISALLIKKGGDA